MKNKRRVNKVVNQIKAAKRKQNSGSDNNPKKNFKYPKGEYVEGLGRRKVAVARVRIYDKGGDFIVNDQLVEEYFESVPFAENKYEEPFKVTKTEGKFGVTVQVKGSGIKGQLDALIHGLARALEDYNPKLRPFLKENDLLTRDPRMKETRKPGRGGRARAKRQSPKR